MLRDRVLSAMDGAYSANAGAIGSRSLLLDIAHVKCAPTAQLWGFLVPLARPLA